MREVEKEVKSKGDVIGRIKVPQFDNVGEAVKFFKEEPKVIAFINRQYMADMTNEFRAANTRTASPIARLSRLAKTNPDLAAKIDKLIERYGGEPAAA